MNYKNIILQNPARTLSARRLARGNKNSAEGIARASIIGRAAGPLSFNRGCGRGGDSVYSNAAKKRASESAVKNQKKLEKDFLN